MKEKIKKIRFLGKILLNIKSFLIFNYDRKLFVNNFINGATNVDTLNYDLLLEIHKLEKGMAAKNLRPFGKDKVKKIIDLLEEHNYRGYEIDFSYSLGISILNKYVEIYNSNNWGDKPEYSLVVEFLKNNNIDTLVDCGAEYIKHNDIKDSLSIDYYDFLKSRRSVRNYKKRDLDLDDVAKACEMAILSPSACNRQMCKLYYIKDQESKKIVERYTKGLSLFELENANYFVITFDINSFYFLDERNQGWLNAGLFCMNFVNALHSLNIGSCIAAFANSSKEENNFKKELEIDKSERIAAIVVCGYYDEISKVPVSLRKEKNDILFIK